MSVASLVLVVNLPIDHERGSFSNTTLRESERANLQITDEIRPGTLPVQCTDCTTVNETLSSLYQFINHLAEAIKHWVINAWAPITCPNPVLATPLIT